MFEEWNEILKAYRASRPRYEKALRNNPFCRDTVPFWLCVIMLLTILAVAPFRYEQPLAPPVILISTGLSMVALIFSREYLAMSYYRDQYRKHAIAHHSLSKREYLLRYALFLHILKKNGVTPEQAARLAEFGKISSPPAKSLNLSQSILLLGLITLLTTLTVEAMKNNEWWQYGSGLLFVFLTALAIFVILLIKLMLNDIHHHNQRIVRYVEWASHDLNKTSPAFNLASPPSPRE